MKRLTRYFVHGLLFSAPLAITAYVIYWLIARLMKFFHPLENWLSGALGLTIPGMGFVLSAALLIGLFMLVGFLTLNFFTRSLMNLFERQLDRFPLAKLLHSSLKDLIGAFVGDKKKFDQPVFVEMMPGSEIKMVGFITRRSMAAWNELNHIAVYLPHSYNFSGFLVIVPKERVTLLDVPTRDVMTFIVSGGVSGDPGRLAQIPKMK